jgi:membrane dipeptidase
MKIRVAAPLLLSACAALTLPVVMGAGAPPVDEQDDLLQRAARIHNAAWVVDTHIDSPAREINGQPWRATDRHTYGEQGAGQWDIPRMIEGGMDAVFLSVFTSQRQLTEEGFAAAYERANSLITQYEGYAASSPIAEIATTVADARRLHAAGRRAFFLGMENGYPIANDLSRVEEFYNRGIRYITLAHTADNQIAASSTQRGDREDYGLTDFGRQVVREMHRLGIMVDVSHVSDKTFYDMLAMSDIPVVLSHSSCRALCDHPRDISDDMLRALAGNGGVIQLVTFRSYVKSLPRDEARQAAMSALRQEFGSPRQLTGEQRAAYQARLAEVNRMHPPRRVTVYDFLEHFEHAVAVAGIDHVGFSSDFNGGGILDDFEDVTALPKITIELLRRGHSEEDITKFWGGNLLRVMQAVEDAAGAMDR